MSAPEAIKAWSPLSIHERRVIGVLIEKQKTTPDIYPLSLNALTVGCNQKSNRDPVLELTDVDVEDTLLAMQKQGLVVRVTGGRVERWRHALYEAWMADKAEMAVLAELLLRGPQTEGELRTRAGRMEPFADLDALRAVLNKLSNRNLVVYLVPEGRRGTTVTHGFHDAAELAQLKSAYASGQAPSAEPRPRSSDLPRGTNNAELEGQVAELREMVTALQATVADLAEQVRRMGQ